MQVKAAYKRKAWEFHPDRFPLDEKSHAESKFKLVCFWDLELLVIMCVLR